MNSLESRNLNEPANVVWVHIVFDSPVSQLVPLICRSAVHRQPVLGILVLVFLKVWHHFLHMQRQTHNFMALYRDNLDEQVQDSLNKSIIIV